MITQLSTLVKMSPERSTDLVNGISLGLVGVAWMGLVTIITEVIVLPFLHIQ